MKTAAYVLVLLSVGCRAPSEPVESPAPGTVQPASAAPQSAGAPSTEAADDEPAERGNGSGGGQGTGGGRFRQAAVYVDGTPIAVLKYGDLPPGLSTTWHERVTSEGLALKVRRFAVADYLAALGIDVARVREVHFYGGRRRIGILPGAELAKHPKEITFSFTQSETGKPRMHWPREVAVTDKIDMVNDLTVYVDKAPPVWSTERWQLELGGQPVDGIPYRTAEVGGGARIYLDGRLVRTIKPKELAPPSGDPPRWTLASQLASAGIPVDRIRALDLIHADRLERRLTGPEVIGATFEATRQSHGRITVFPAEVMTDVLQVYVAAAPVNPAER